MDVIEIQSRLEASRAKLVARAKSPAAQDLVAKADDQPTESCLATIKSQLNRNASEQVSQIDRALWRLERGIYGKCAECDKPIADKRLNAIPEAESCTECLNKRSSGPQYRIPGMQNHSTTGYDRF